MQQVIDYSQSTCAQDTRLLFAHDSAINRRNQVLKDAVDKATISEVLHGRFANNLLFKEAVLCLCVVIIDA